MVLLRLVLALVLPLLLVACGEDEPASDPCHGITCLAGFDCRAGQCVERLDPDPTGCEVNSDCFQNPAGPFCDRGSGSCVACLDDDHCGERSCSGGACVGEFCSTDEECAAPAPLCSAAGDACVACRGTDDCAAGEACDGGACVPLPVECTTDLECEEAAPTRPHCRVENGRGLCVECRRATDCEGGVDCLGGVCVDLACVGDEDCAGFPDRAMCGSEGSCVGCEEDGDCAGGGTCNAGLCESPLRCASNDDCVGSADGAICDPASGACVPCVGDGDCAFGEICRDRTSCEAVVCEGTADCPLGSRCDEGACIDPGPCGAAADCAFDPRAPQCNDAGACVACTADAHCSTGQRCIAEVCAVPQDCSADSQCKGAFVCNGGLCGACRTDDQCARGVCSAGACVNEASCASDVDCATGVCAGGTCAACATTLDCAAGLWCDAGACVPPPSCASTVDCGPGRTCEADSCSAPSCSGEEEPNDGPTQATPFSPGVPLSRTLCANDEDWFVFSAAQGSALSASLLAAPAGTTITLAWYDPATRDLRTLRGIGARVLARKLAPAAQGRYYLRVHAAEGNAGSYGLLASVTVGGGSCTDLLEPNDVRTAPRAVAVGEWLDGLYLCGDDDFYMVDVPAGRSLHAYIFPEGGQPVNIQIFGLDGSGIGNVRNSHPFLGGGEAATVAPAATPRTLLVKASKLPPADLRYALYLAMEDDPACSAALPLIGGDRARIVSATLGLQADQPPGACGGGGPDVAYRVVVDSSRRFVAQVRAPFPVRLSLRSASCTGTELGCSAALLSGVGILDVPRLDAGAYTLVVGSMLDGAGPFELAAQLLPPINAPPNDGCGGAISLDLSSGSAGATGNTSGARADSTLSCAPGAPEVFYRFTLANPARVVIDLQATGPASLALLGASCFGQVACEGPQAKPRIDRQLPAGEHRIAVAASSGAPVGFTLQVSLPAPVPNDTCATAAPLAVPGSVSGDTTWAAGDLSLPLATSCTGYLTGGPETFYALALAAGQRVTATLTPAPGYDAALYVIRSCASAQCLAGVDAAFEQGVETLVFTAPTAGTYLLVVDGSSTGGGYTLQVQ